ncbi:MAG: sugar transferase [Deltaproteobacteria bacterium]|nr:sugar transferase [Deltaproteobacteria bacterium]
MKRAFDVVCGSLGLILLSPLFLLVSIAIRLESAGPVFFRGVRVGWNGRSFEIFKFRTMVDGAAVSGPAITVRGDLRVTRVGHFLRETKVDELPQLINVVLGDMSLVGPRPEDPKYVAAYTPEQKMILAFRPGITSPASIAYRDESELLAGADWEGLYVYDIMPKKLEMDMKYFPGASFLGDLRIIFRTIY